MPPPLAIALLLALAARDPLTPEDRDLHLVVLHTNDVHGQVLPRPARWLEADPPPECGGLVRLAAGVEGVRQKARAEGFELLVVDGGDWSQGTPEGQLDGGRAFLQALTKVRYDAMAVGNHEFDLGLDLLLEHLARVRPPAILANATPRDGRDLAGVAPYRIVRRGGLRIALVGLLTPRTPIVSHRSAWRLRWREPAEVLAELKVELAGRVDWILPVTHQGLEADRALARAHPDLVLIVGGHSHDLLPEGELEGRTLIVQAGSRATALGRVDLWFDRRTKEVVGRQARILPLYGPGEAYGSDEGQPEASRALRSACARLLRRTRRRWDATVGELAGPLTRSTDRWATSPAGNAITDLMREGTGADVALLGPEAIRWDLAAGSVTRRALFQCLPFDDQVVTVTLTGAELSRRVRAALEVADRRGLEFSGMTVLLEVTETTGGQPRLAGLRVGGRWLAAGARLRVALLHRGSPDGRGPRPRELLEQALARGPLTPPTENRYRIVPRKR